MAILEYDVRAIGLKILRSALQILEKPCPNTNKVPQKQWRKWTNQAREVFNSVYSQMRRDQAMFQHPNAKRQPREHWNTTAWNAAWTAADAVMGVDAVSERAA